MVQRQFRPDPHGASNPFVAGIDGQGPSSSNWDLQHLKWLRIDYSDRWPLFTDTSAESTGLFDEKFSADCRSRFSRRIVERLGLPWNEVVEERDLPPHYAALLSLSEPRWEDGINCLASSSVVAPSQDLRTSDDKLNEPTPGRSSSPHPPLTPTRPPTKVSEIRENVDHLASSPPSLSNPHTATTLARVDVETPAHLRTGLQHPLSRQSAVGEDGAKTASEALQQSGVRKFSALSPNLSTIDTPAQSKGTMASSSPTDRNYTPALQPGRGLRMTQNKYEIEVVIAGQACVNVISDELRYLSDSKLKSEVVIPNALRVMVEGLQCNSKLDLRNTTKADGHPDSEIKYAVAFGEVQQQPIPTNQTQ